MPSAHIDSISAELPCACPCDSHSTLLSVAMTHPKYPSLHFTPPSDTRHMLSTICRHCSHKGIVLTYSLNVLTFSTVFVSFIIGFGGVLW
eukprot:4992034-Ditylum_brightwellii.AAC.1